VVDGQDSETELRVHMRSPARNLISIKGVRNRK
jgi:hypothetical protein